jgi:hypothetical protein
MIIIKTVKQKSKNYKMIFTSDYPTRFLVHGDDGSEIICADGIVYYPSSIKMYIVGSMFFGQKIFYSLYKKTLDKDIEISKYF